MTWGMAMKEPCTGCNVQMLKDEGATCSECTRQALSKESDVEVVSHHAINIVLVAGRPVAVALVIIEELVRDTGKTWRGKKPRGNNGVHIMPLR